MTKRRLNEDRTFGVEVEMAIGRGTARDLARDLSRNGFDTDVTYYHGTTSSRWKIESDSSCGYELVSPILKGKEGLNELEQVLEIINEDSRVKVNTSCGVHVHHDVTDYSGKQLKRIYAVYHKFEDVIDSLLPNSRRANNNNYCKSIKYTDHAKLGFQSENYTIDALDRAETISDIEEIYNSRYLKVNCQKYREIGTIEFRQHSGSTDFEKIRNWILLTQAIVESARTRVKMPETTDYKYKDSLTDFFMALKIANYQDPAEEFDEVREYYKMRKEYLAIPYSERRGREMRELVA